MLVHIAGPGELGTAHTALELLLLGVGGQVPVILGVVSQLPAAVQAAVVAFLRGIHLKARKTLHENSRRNQYARQNKKQILQKI
jgi:hypothetical protein